MCFGYFDLGLASEANAYHRFAILELTEDASAERCKRSGFLQAVKKTDAPESAPDLPLASFA